MSLDARALSISYPRVAFDEIVPLLKIRHGRHSRSKNGVALLRL
jgi:hypothetical protein